MSPRIPARSIRSSRRRSHCGMRETRRSPQEMRNSFRVESALFGPVHWSSRRLLSASTSSEKDVSTAEYHHQAGTCLHASATQLHDSFSYPSTSPKPRIPVSFAELCQCVLVNTHFLRYLFSFQHNSKLFMCSQGSYIDDDLSICYFSIFIIFFVSLINIVRNDK